MKVPFPTEGLSTGAPASGQPLKTSFSLQNVRAFDVTDERIRGGQRSGTVLAYTNQIVRSNPVIDMTAMVTTYIQPGT